MMMIIMIIIIIIKQRLTARKDCFSGWCAYILALFVRPWASYKSSTKRQQCSRKNGRADILRTDALGSVLHHTIDIHHFR